VSEAISTASLFAQPFGPVLQQMFNTIRIRAMGVTDEQVQLEFVQAADLFFSESNVWQTDGTITISEPTAIIGLQGWLSGAEVVFPFKVKWNDVPLQPVADVAAWVAAQNTTPQVFMFNAQKNMTLAPMPDANGGVLHIYTVLRPMLTAPMIPDQLIAEWFDGLLDTVLGRLYLQPGKPFSNLNLGMLHSRKSRAWISKARDVANRGFAGGNAPWTFPYFANGSGSQLWGWGKGVWA
jgi:hypothetical protein